MEVDAPDDCDDPGSAAGGLRCTNRCEDCMTFQSFVSETAFSVAQGLDSDSSDSNV